MAAFLQKLLCLNFFGMHLCSYPHSNEWEMHFQRRARSNVNLLAVLRHAVCVFPPLALPAGRDTGGVATSSTPSLISQVEIVTLFRLVYLLY